MGYSKASVRRKLQIRYILENMTEPDFSLGDDNILADSLGIEYDPRLRPDEYFNTRAITMRIMNHNFGHNQPYAEPSTTSAANFMKSIQDYLPKSIRGDCKTNIWSCIQSFQESRILKEYTPNGCGVEPELGGLLFELRDWLSIMKQKIEDHLATRYYSNPKAVNMLEILKRRYKTNWSERTETEVQADVKQDTTLNITFEDA